MQFTTTVLSLLAVGSAVAFPATSPAPGATIGEPQCIPIADKPQTLITKDCQALLTKLQAQAKLPNFGCNKMLAPKGEYVTYAVHKSCRVMTAGDSGAQQCVHPRVVAPALEALINKCHNQWGFMEDSQIEIIGEPLANRVRVWELDLPL